jgi:hypothetical protein
MYGPDKAMINLESTGDAYQGNYEGAFDVTVTGLCNKYDSFPVTFDATTPKENEFRYLDFSVKMSLGYTFAPSCLSGDPPIKMPPVTDTLTFTLPAKDGASKLYRISGGGAGKLTLIFTLRKQEP